MEGKHEIKTESKGTSTVMLAVVVCVALIAGIAFGYFVGNTMYPPTVAKTSSADMSNLTSSVERYLTVNFLESYNASAKIVNYTDLGDLLSFNVSIMDKNGSKMDEGSVYITKDGGYMVSIMYNLSAPFPTAPAVTDDTGQQQVETQKNVSKVEKPMVELYVFSYCPAGTAALDAYGKVGKLLGGIADMKVRFFSDMHGAHELQQNKIQACIQAEDPSKYWDYVGSYVARIYTVCGGSRDINCDKNESIKLMDELGINSGNVMKCLEESGDSLYSDDVSRATFFGLSYSPSIVVNDLSFGPDFTRTPTGIKDLVCSAFVTPPAECSQTLGESAAPSGSCG